MKRRLQSTFNRLWLGPLAIAVASAAALYLALAHEGVIDIVSGVVLTIVGLIGLSLLRS
ncbi:MAG: hypothetical protein MI723_11905 [Caulobacterales bacterium]|nr:hypothetical protein [Caulobacterales bacterium]